MDGTQDWGARRRHFRKSLATNKRAYAQGHIAHAAPVVCNNAVLHPQVWIRWPVDCVGECGGGENRVTLVSRVAGGSRTLLRAGLSLSRRYGRGLELRAATGTVSLVSATRRTVKAARMESVLRAGSRVRPRCARDKRRRGRSARRARNEAMRMARRVRTIPRSGRRPPRRCARRNSGRLGVREVRRDWRLSSRCSWRMTRLA